MDEQASTTEQKKRTVTIACAITQGLQMSLNDPAKPGVVILKQGNNPNIDKAFVDEWRERNANLTIMPFLSFTDDPEPESAKSAEENDDGSGRPAPSHDGVQDAEAAHSEDAGVRRGNHDVGHDAGSGAGGTVDGHELGDRHK